MKKSDKITYRQKTLLQLFLQLSDLRLQFNQLKAKQSTGKLKDSSLFKKTRYQIALIKTLITQKQNEPQTKPESVKN